MDSDQLRQRIKNRLRAIGRGPIQAARKGGLERTYIHDFVNGTKDSIKIDKYPQIAKGLDWTVEELEGSPQGDHHEPDAILSVPEYDLRAGAAYGGGLPDEQYATDEAGNTILSEGLSASWGLPRPFL